LGFVQIAQYNFLLFSFWFGVAFFEAQERVFSGGAGTLPPAPSMDISFIQREFVVVGMFLPCNFS
jgi:hypothetical protein